MRSAVMLAVGLALFAGSLRLEAQPTPLTMSLVSNTFVRPLYVTAPAGDFGRIFVVEQRGSAGISNRADIRVVEIPANNVLPTPFLSVTPVSTGSEQGLLGLAFHPRYLENGYFWINYTDSAGDTRIVRYRVLGDPRVSNVADPNSRFDVAFMDQPFSNHNGGWIAFAPGDTQGYLYIGMGDGGSAGDPGNRAQNINEPQLLGKIVRIDIDGPDNIVGNADDDELPADPRNNYAIPPSNPFVNRDGRDEIWAYGVRNPWRNTFDRGNGDFYIADVGQGSWEEVNYRAAGSPGGENYGWRCYEGNAPYNPTGCPPPNTMIFPIHVYSHVDGCSITGGHVYRGCAIPDLRGTYFFADYCSARVWSFRVCGGQMTDFRERTAELTSGGALSSITSFGEDASGEMYICVGASFNGTVYKIVPRGVPAARCCPGDVNGDGAVDQADLGILLASFNLCPGDANYDSRANLDASSDCCVGQSDLGILLGNWGRSCP